MYIGGIKMEIGDLICATKDTLFYSGYGIITEFDSGYSKWVKIYWLAHQDYAWEQIYHLEAYCEKGS